MIEVRTNADEVAKALQAIQRDFPREFPRAFATLAKGLKKHGKDLVQKGRSAKLGIDLGFTPHNQLTVLAYGRRKFGGKLGTSIRAYVTQAGAFIGWPTALAHWGDKFQTSESRPWDAKERRRFFAIARNKAEKFLLPPGFVDEKALAKWAKNQVKARTRLGDQESALLDDTYNRPARVVWDDVVNTGGFKRYCRDVISKRIAAILEKRAKGKR